MRPRLSALIILLLCVPWGQPAGAARINLSPVFFYESSDDAYTATMAGPILEFSSERKAVRPLYYQDEQHLDILYPLSQSSENKTVFFPLYSSVDEKDQRYRNLFPFFYGSYKDRSYGGIFPLYGTFYHRFGYDEIRFALWPVYSSTAHTDTRTYHVLWPIFSYSRNRTFKIFPLYGYEKSVDEHKDFVLWPIFLRTRGQRNMDAALPLFLYARGDTFKNISVIWPLFTYNRDSAAGHTSIDAPWPLVRYATGGYEETRIFPLYRKKLIAPTYSVETILWPMYRKELNYDGAGELIRDRTSILILSNTTHAVSPLGEERRSVTCWPVWHHSATSRESSWYVPWILPFQAEAYKRTWQPLLTLARGERSEAEDTELVDILWHTIFYRRDGDFSRFSLSLLFSYETRGDTAELGFLFDLLKLQLHRRSPYTPSAP